MLPKTHFWATLALTIATMLFSLTTPLQAAVILIGGFLIDTDHYLLYVFKEKDFSLRKAYKWFYLKYLTREKRKNLYLFHTVESFSVILLLGFINPLFFYLWAGMTFHLALDIIQAINHGFYAKSISITADAIKYLFHKT